LAKEKILILAGLLIISAGIVLNERLLALLLDLSMSTADKIIIRFFDLYLIVTGIMVIFFRKSIPLKRSIVLFGLYSFLCFILFLLYDFSQAYLGLTVHHSETGPHKTVHMKDPYLGWKPKPNSSGTHISEDNFAVMYEIDENGFKKVKNNMQNPDFSIYFFGDSLTFGYGVSNKDTFPNIIKDKYLKKNINIYNLGVSAYGIVQMFQRFLNIEDRIQKGDLVIFSPVSGDIERNIKDFYFLYYLILSNSLPGQNLPFFDNGAIIYLKIEDNLYNRLKASILAAPYAGAFWRSVHKRFIPDTTREALEMIQIIKDKTEVKGAEFVFFFLPHILECLRGRYDVDISGFDYYDIMHFFPSRKEELDELVFQHDKHWNVKGHQLLARAIVETLIEEKILDKKYLESDLNE
jgi:hypothetical protein